MTTMRLELDTNVHLNLGQSSVICVVVSSARRRSTYMSLSVCRSGMPRTTGYRHISDAQCHANPTSCSSLVGLCFTEISRRFFLSLDLVMYTVSHENVHNFTFEYISPNSSNLLVYQPILIILLYKILNRLSIQCLQIFQIT